MRTYLSTFRPSGYQFPLHLAVDNRKIKVADFIIEKYPELVCTRDDYDRLPVEIAAYMGFTEIVNKLSGLRFKNLSSEEENFSQLFVKLVCMIVNASYNGTLEKWMEEEIEKLELSNRRKLVSKRCKLIHMDSSPFNLACKYGNIKLIEYFLFACNAD